MSPVHPVSIDGRDEQILDLLASNDGLSTREIAHAIDISTRATRGQTSPKTAMAENDRRSDKELRASVKAYVEIRELSLNVLVPG